MHGLVTLNKNLQKSREIDLFYSQKKAMLEIFEKQIVFTSNIKYQ